MLKLILFPFKVVFFYIPFGPLLLIKRFWKAYLVLFLASLIGCASTANTMERSPCACDYELINVSNDGGRNA